MAPCLVEGRPKTPALSNHSRDGLGSCQIVPRYHDSLNPELVKSRHRNLRRRLHSISRADNRYDSAINSQNHYRLAPFDKLIDLFLQWTSVNTALFHQLHSSHHHFLPFDASSNSKTRQVFEALNPYRKLQLSPLHLLQHGVAQRVVGFSLSPPNKSESLVFIPALNRCDFRDSRFSLSQRPGLIEDHRLDLRDAF